MSLPFCRLELCYSLPAGLLNVCKFLIDGMSSGYVAVGLQQGVPPYLDLYSVTLCKSSVWSYGAVWNLEKGWRPNQMSWWVEASAAPLTKIWSQNTLVVELLHIEYGVWRWGSFTQIDIWLWPLTVTDFDWFPDVLMGRSLGGPPNENMKPKHAKAGLTHIFEWGLTLGFEKSRHREIQ